PLGAGRDALDQPFQLTAIDALDAHLLAVCECQVVESIEERVWCRRDDERTVRRPLARAQAMVCEVLARQSVGEREMRCVLLWHRSSTKATSGPACLTPLSDDRRASHGF